MKKLFSLCLLVAMASANRLSAQGMPSLPYNEDKKAIIYTEVVEMSGKTKDQLYDKALLVLNDIYKEVDKKAELKDKASGTIRLKCSIRVMLKDPKTKVTVASPEYIKYRLALSFKDGKYRYEFYDFHADKGGYKYPIEKYYFKDEATMRPDSHPEERMTYMDNEVKSIIARLKAGMTGEAVEKKDEW